MSDGFSENFLFGLLWVTWNSYSHLPNLPCSYVKNTFIQLSAVEMKTSTLSPYKAFLHPESLLESEEGHGRKLEEV